MSDRAAPFSAVAVTDVARRDHNEDAFLINEELGLVIVADGVGGHQGGEVASGMTCEVLGRELAVGSSLEQAIRAADAAVTAAVAQGRGSAGMASTVVAVQLDGAAYRLAWVGDSRAYLWDGRLKLLTRDHSLVQSLLDQGVISQEQARHHPRGNVIVQAIGLRGEGGLQVGGNAGQLAAGEWLLLCSDGLTDALDSAALADILCRGDSLQQCCRALVDAALAAGGSDNVTVALVAVAAPATRPVSPGQPEVVWTFDPASGKTLGLATAPDAGMSPTEVKRIAPRRAESAPIVPAGEPPPSPGATRRHSRIFWLLLLILVAASLLYSLAVAGIG